MGKTETKLMWKKENYKKDRMENKFLVTSGLTHTTNTSTYSINTFQPIII